MQAEVDAREGLGAYQPPGLGVLVRPRVPPPGESLHPLLGARILWEFLVGRPPDGVSQGDEECELLCAERLL